MKIEKKVFSDIKKDNLILVNILLEMLITHIQVYEFLDIKVVLNISELEFKLILSEKYLDQVTFSIELFDISYNTNNNEYLIKIKKEVLEDKNLKFNYKVIKILNDDEISIGYKLLIVYLLINPKLKEHLKEEILVETRSIILEINKTKNIKIITI